jgi:tRNAThr (cytosine32-N3)-methyltransferase
VNSIHDMTAAADSQEQTAEMAARNKQPKNQLTRGMEHMRPYVTVETPPPSTGEDTYGVPATYEPIRKPATDSSKNEQKRSDPFQFGTRFLEEGDDIFAHNAWDHVEVDPEYGQFIEQQTTFQRENQVSDFDKKRFNDRPEKWWDKFYSNNQANFFKDRKWLVQEFPILGRVTQEHYGPVTVLEVGAGAGNTAFPLLANNENPHLRLHACDYSKKAIEVIRSQPAYQQQPRPILQADVWDAAGAELPPGLDAASVDVIVMIFIFSALSPDQWAQAVANARRLLKPGGEILFRDYGRGDLAQVRFKKGRYLDENFYVRGDGTRVYFFEERELRAIWGDGGEGDADAAATPAAREDATNMDDRPDARHGPTPGFEILNLAVDRRMLVNRQRKLKMYRCWMQGRFRKPLDEVEEARNSVVSRMSTSDSSDPADPPQHDG